MSVKRFLDTNILLYGYDLDSGPKRDVALGIMKEAWLKPESTAISVQVLQEFYVNFTRKKGSDADARQSIQDLSLWVVIDNSLELFGMGLNIQQRFSLSLWDSMIVAAAIKSGAKELITEDLNHGQLYESVRALNPFKL